MLISLAKSNPETIKRCFVQGLNRIESEENIDMRLFYPDTHGRPLPIIITVNKNRVATPRYIKNGAIWPKLLEKAWMIYESKGLLTKVQRIGFWGKSRDTT